MLTARAPARSSRLAGAAGVLLMQGGFFLLFLTSMPVLPPPAQVARDIVLRLPRFYLPPPPKPPGQSQGLPGPVTVTPPLPLLQSLPGYGLTPRPAAPDIGAFGQALNGCAPEDYARLTPEQRARCAGPGVMVEKEPDPLVTRGLAKGEAMFQEQWDEKHWMPGLCDTAMEASVAACLMHQAIAEVERAADVNWHLARDKAREKAEHLKPPVPPPPKSKGSP